MVHERKVIEKVLQELEVSSIERGEAKSVKLARSAFERLGISRCENYFGSLGACSPSSFQTHAGAAANHNDGLTTQRRLDRSVTCNSLHRECSLLSGWQTGSSHEFHSKRMSGRKQSPLPSKTRT